MYLLQSKLDYDNNFAGPGVHYLIHRSTVTVPIQRHMSHTTLSFCYWAHNNMAAAYWQWSYYDTIIWLLAYNNCLLAAVRTLQCVCAEHNTTQTECTQTHTHTHIGMSPWKETLQGSINDIRSNIWGLQDEEHELSIACIHYQKAFASIPHSWV